jgi:hypothetical protein
LKLSCCMSICISLILALPNIQVFAAPPLTPAAKATALPKTPAATKPAPKPAKVKPPAKIVVTPQAKFDKQFKLLKKRYRNGELSDKVMWQRLAKLFADAQRQPEVNASALLQLQANLLQLAKYPVVSAKYASLSLTSSTDPYGFESEASWRLLNDLSHKTQINDMLIDLAKNLVWREKLPAAFKRNWYYFKAEAMEQQQKDAEAQVFYAMLKPEDRYYLAAQYQLAMILYGSGDRPKAIQTLVKMTDPALKLSKELSKVSIRQYQDYANLALGRMEYEGENYTKAVTYFRKVSKNGPVFYDTLFEQSWALFLAGFPKHSLGALHGASSPFFKDRYNPEVALLRALEYYWMCRYDDSKTAMAEFIDDYSVSINELEKFLQRRNLNALTAYQLFENLISGVSSESLGLKRELLISVAGSDRMKYARDRLASVVAERTRLNSKGIFLSKNYISYPKKLVDEWVLQQQQNLGMVYINELNALEESYQQLRGQADFLYIELLMSEKEQVMGRELHSASKLSKLSPTQKIAGWGKAEMPWRASAKGEYWWDEVGFYIYDIEPLCNQPKQEEAK